MGKYIDLKNKIDKLNEKNEIIQLDKQSLVAPLYEIANTYKDRLDRILPKNIDSINSNNLVLRISVLYEEVKEMDLDYIKQKTILNKINDVKNEIIKLNKEQDEIDDSMIEIAPELERRKNYVLEKIDEQEIINNKINDYRKKINKRLEFLKIEDLEPEIVSSVNNIIKKLNSNIIEAESNLENILSEDGLSDDINYFANNFNSDRYDINNLLTKEDKLKLNKRISNDDTKIEEEKNIIVESEKKNNIDEEEFIYPNVGSNIHSEVEEIDNLIEFFNRQIYKNDSEPSEFNNYKVSKDEANLIPKEKEIDNKFKNLKFPADSVLNFPVENIENPESSFKRNQEDTIIFKDSKNEDKSNADSYIKEIADQISEAIASLDTENETKNKDIKEQNNESLSVDTHIVKNNIDLSESQVKNIANQISESIRKLDDDNEEYYYDKKDDEEDKQNLDNNTINSYMDAEYEVVEENKQNNLIEKIKNIKKFRLSIAIPSIISRFAKINANEIISKSKDNFAEARYLLENKLNFFSQEEVNETIDIMKKIKYLKQSVKAKGRYFTRKELNELKKYNKELETYLNYLYSTRNFDEINIRKIR